MEVSEMKTQEIFDAIDMKVFSTIFDCSTGNVYNMVYDKIVMRERSGFMADALQMIFFTHASPAWLGKGHDN
tara:strand:- start:241 stop:456 length:216 start_codon:yes stop_codon:yes gene_type:complete